MKKLLIILVILIISSSTVFSQRVISGRVTKVGGGILTAVKVCGKEAPAIFTFTDDKGLYKIELPKEVKHLVFSYSGMENKTVKIKEFDNINANLTPVNYKKFRYGLGLAYGASKFNIKINDPIQNNDFTEITMTPISIHGDLFYRFHRQFDIQVVIEDGLNIAEVETDSTYINDSGVTDTVNYTEKLYLNRVSSSIILNYYFPFTEARNYSVFVGLGPQFQHLSFLKTNTVGARFQTGINLNEHGFTTRFYLAIDVSSGKFKEDNEYVPGFPYNYSSGRLGVVFIF
ncbi:MAG: hypothetical protein K8R54_01115 [Bacteroidales bacterium]|nr:hypothetical protein [Bacteroidales bacterium]